GLQDAARLAEEARALLAETASGCRLVQRLVLPYSTGQVTERAALEESHLARAVVRTYVRTTPGASAAGMVDGTLPEARVLLAGVLERLPPVPPLPLGHRVVEREVDVVVHVEWESAYVDWTHHLLDVRLELLASNPWARYAKVELLCDADAAVLAAAPRFPHHHVGWDRPHDGWRTLAVRATARAATPDDGDLPRSLSLWAGPVALLQDAYGSAAAALDPSAVAPDGGEQAGAATLHATGSAMPVASGAAAAMASLAACLAGAALLQRRRRR
ncbi:MAG TPA: hypothetical protein VFH47_01660, partial [Candidatus Thermoplasmatota archaeon]|nr:hypothetical protein [Candidatus Thermoplasmatota archaeon]